MLTKRIIPCLDVKDGKVVKGVKFRDHEIVGDIVNLASFYSDEGADELVFYDIIASCEGRSVDTKWVKSIAETIQIPFCVAGGIRSLQDAEAILNAGADKISINTPALLNPDLINALNRAFGKQCIVVGIDSWQDKDTFKVHQFTGDERKMQGAQRDTFAWAREVVDRGAGEIVLNCMNQDGVKNGYDISQYRQLRDLVNIPIIASGGAGTMQHFADVFQEANVDGALAASVFHHRLITIETLKDFLAKRAIEVRPCD